MDLDKAIKKRFSCRKFKSKKPDWKKITEAIEAGTKAPLAGNIPTVRYIVVSDKEKIKALSEACARGFDPKVHYAVVVCSDSKKCVVSYEDRGKKYCFQQAGAAIENFLLKITDLGLAAGWVGAFADDTIRKILQIPEDVEIETILPVGYAMGKTEQRTKADVDVSLYFDKWKNRTMGPVKKPEA